MATSGPWSEQFPVAFYSGGDTTRDAFDKHIQEIHRIYGLINDLDADKLSSSELDGKLNSRLGDFDTKLQKHIDSTNPHPNWKPSLSFSDITGNLEGSRITGTLTKAYIDASHVNNLQSFVQNLIPPSGGNGDGITDKNTNENGYIKFANGFIIQWGKDTPVGTGARTVTFPIAFSSKCLGVSCTSYITDNQANPIGWPVVLEYAYSTTTKSDFRYSLRFPSGGSNGGMSGYGVYFIAYGI